MYQLPAWPPDRAVAPVASQKHEYRPIDVTAAEEAYSRRICYTLTTMLTVLERSDKP